MSSHQFDEEFDYIVIGAGSAGATIAARLSEDENVTVKVLEAGGSDNHPLIKTPMGFAFWPENPKQNWNFDTLPQEHLNGRCGFQPRGKVLGGSSSLNAMIYIRGVASDYNRWASMGASGWGWEDVLPYFKKAEHNERGESHLHGTGGPLRVSDLRYKNPLCDTFLEAASSLQLPSNDDFNGDRQEGVGYYQVTVKDGERCSAAAAYLHPNAERQNLSVTTGAHTEQILIEGNRAIGVRYRDGGKQNGQAKTVGARREVILSAGAFQSPQLLMLSGIGPAAHLAQLGVPVLVDTPGVGENLQDHLDYCALRRTASKDSVGLNTNFLVRLPGALMTYQRERRGVLSSNIAEAGGFLKTSPDLEEPDIQLHFVPGLVDDHGRKKHWGGGYSCHVCVLRPKSRGTVRLSSANPLDDPAIDPNFLSDPDDLDRLVKGAELVFRIFETPTFDAVRGAPMYLADGDNKDALIEDIRNRADTIYHPVGTCRMGASDDPMAVLTPDLRVKGIDRLRVADASVMPSLIGGNTNAPSIMIGEKAADIIKAA